MVFNFRKIASVIASTVMVGSTIAIAAAANYPAPFVQNGNPDVALVYGSKAAPTDFAAVIDITSSLQGALAKQTATAGSGSSPISTSGGDSVAIASTSAKLNIGTNMTDVKTTNLVYSDLPTILAKGTYSAADSQNYDYEQELKIAPNLQFKFFADNDYNDNSAPVLGFKVPTNSPLMNYTLTFKTPAQSSVDSNGRLDDLQGTTITMLGKDYTLLNAYNSTTKFELMAGAATDTVNYGEEKTVTVGDKTYKVKLTYVGTKGSVNVAKFTVNGQSTTTGGMQVGDTFTLTDGTQFGVRDISYQAYAGGIQSAEFTIGAEKLTIQDGNVVKLADKNINDLMAYISRGTSSDKVTINSITLAWIPSDNDAFLTPDQSLTMPGLGAVKFLMGNLTMPDVETLKVSPDSSAIQVSAVLKDGPVSFDLIGGNGTTFTTLGKDSTNKLATSSSTSLTYDKDTDSYFVASYKTSTAAESYLLKASFSQDTSTTPTTNLTTIESAKVGDRKCENYKQGQVCTIGSVALTIGQIDYSGKSVALTTNGEFNTLYTKDGLKMFLPVDTTGTPTRAQISNLTTAGTTTQYTIQFTEEDKSNTIANGKNFNITVGWDGNSNAQVASTPTGPFSGGSMLKTEDGSKVDVGYLNGELGTKITYDHTATPYSASVEYHGGETYGNVFVAAPTTTVSGGSVASSGTTGSGTVRELGSPVFADTEAASAAGKNLIVVGGSCINTVAAKLLGSDTPLCGADFTGKTTVADGQFLIKTFAYSGKVATLVAGYNAQDTLNAAKYLKTQTVDTTVGKAYKGTSETSATPIVDAAPVTPATTGNQTGNTAA